MSVTRLRVLPESEERLCLLPGYECYRRVREIVSVTRLRVLPESEGDCVCYQVTSVTGE